ncbi:hypothetical protein [Novosphingobium sp.]|uniref:hypothetical protein n=1 Tax=Novosphingobium sp. TaxID=1874826 RepID=UPI0038B7A4EC
MLLFIDEPRNLKLVRQIPETGSREPLGKIKKQLLAIPEDVLPNLSTEEVAEVEAAFELVAQGEAARVKLLVANFPATIREALSYYKDGASAVEQRWILGALLEGLRVVRRHERETGV